MLHKQSIAVGEAIPVHAVQSARLEEGVVAVALYAGDRKDRQRLAQDIGHGSAVCAVDDDAVLRQGDGGYGGVQTMDYSVVYQCVELPVMR